MTENKVLKTISQETFDNVVQENIQDFDMEPDEALEDAIQQFKSQGVNLNIIIKELPQNNRQHKVLNLVQSLSDVVTKGTCEEDFTKEILKQLEEELRDLSKKYQACKLTNATDNIFRLCKLAAANHCHELESFKTFSSLINGQPDEATVERLCFFVEILRGCENEDLVEVITCIIKNASTMQENNRQVLVKMGIIDILMDKLEQFIESLDVIRECCAALRALTLDDDVRVPFGKAHDHAKAIVTENDGLERLVAVLKEHHSDISLAKEISSTLSRVMVRNEFCQQFIDLGGFSVLRDLVQTHLSNVSVVKQCVNLVQAISGNDDVKVHLVKNGSVEMLMSVLGTYPANPSICESCFAALTTVSLRNPSHCKYITDKKIAPTVIQAMEIHKNHAGVQKQACRLIRNLVARTREHSFIFLELGAEELIREARKQHSTSLDDEAKAALRDLDLEVDLKQLWTGGKPGVTC